MSPWWLHFGWKGGWRERRKIVCPLQLVTRSLAPKGKTTAIKNGISWMNEPTFHFTWLLYVKNKYLFLNSTITVLRYVKQKICGGGGHLLRDNYLARMHGFDNEIFYTFLSTNEFFLARYLGEKSEIPFEINSSMCITFEECSKYLLCPFPLC